MKQFTNRFPTWLQRANAYHAIAMTFIRAKILNKRSYIITKVMCELGSSFFLQRLKGGSLWNYLL